MTPLFIIISLIFFGSGALVPLMYFASHGLIQTEFIFFSAMCTFLIVDLFFYLIGNKITSEKIKQAKYFHARPHHFDNLEKALRKYGLYFSFWSKFIFGSGVPTQILIGAYRFPILKVFFINIAGAFAWISTVYVLAQSIKNLSELKEDIFTAQISFLIFIVFAFFIYYFVSKGAKKFFKITPEELNTESNIKDSKQSDSDSNRNI